jgi:hypothetical protein
VYLLISRRWRLLKEMRLFSGILLFLAVAAPWFVAVSLRNPEFARFFFIHEHFERFTSTVHGRYQPFWFFVPVLLGTMLPWSFFIPGALTRAWRDRHHEEGRAGVYLVIWTAVIFLFFSKSSSKLVPYILPIFPPLAILVGHRFDALLDGKGRDIKGAALLLGLALVLAGSAALAYARLPEAVAFLSGVVPAWSNPLAQFVRNAPPFSLASSLVIGALFLLQGLTALRAAGRNPLALAAVLCFGSFLLTIMIPRLIMGEITKAESPRELARTAASLAGPETVLVTFGPLQGVSWYTGRRVLVTGDRDELDFGSRQGDQAAWFPDQAALLKLWGEKHCLIFLKKRELEQLRPLLEPPPIVKIESGRRLLVSNR